MTGKLVYLVGASGSGKDSIIKTIEQQFPDKVVVARRYITRPNADNDDAHVALDIDAFNKLAKQGQFSMQWQANGYWYGITNDITSFLDSGVDVIVNGSRDYAISIHRKFPQALTVHVVVDESIWLRRLAQRGRENTKQINARIKRHRNLTRKSPSFDATIYNNGSLDLAAQQLVKIIENHR